MNFLLDICLIVLFLLIVIICACRGFVRCIWSMLTIVGAFVLAYVFGPTVGGWIGETFVYEYVSSYTYDTLDSIVDESGNEFAVSDVFDSMPDELIDLLNRCGADYEDIKTELSSSLTVSNEQLRSISDSISLPISTTISNIIGIVVVFFGALLAISLLGLILKLVVKVPVIKSIDSFLGAILGIAEAFVVIWVVCLIIGLLVEHSFISNSQNEELLLIAKNSYILRFFCDLSPINFINICKNTIYEWLR